MFTVGIMMFVPLASGIKVCVDAEMQYENALVKYNDAKFKAESMEKEIIDKNMRKIKIEGIISAYRHSKVITEFSEDLCNGILDKCVVYRDHVEFIWK